MALIITPKNRPIPRDTVTKLLRQLVNGLKPEYFELFRPAWNLKPYRMADFFADQRLANGGTGRNFTLKRVRLFAVTML